MYSKMSSALANAEPQELRVAAPHEHLPDERTGFTKKFKIAGHKGYLSTGTYPDGRLGEIFIIMAKEGSTISGLTDALAISVSIGLQHGVPLSAYTDKFVDMRFEPSGNTIDSEIKEAKSIVDYVFRWLAKKFLPPQEPTSS